MTIPAQSSVPLSFQFGLIIHCHVSGVIASWSLAHGVIVSIWSHNNDSPLTPFQEKIFHLTSWFSREALVQHPCEALIIFILLHRNISTELYHTPSASIQFYWSCVLLALEVHLFMLPLSSQPHAHISIKPKFHFPFNSYHKFVPVIWTASFRKGVLVFPVFLLPRYGFQI